MKKSNDKENTGTTAKIGGWIIFAIILIVIIVIILDIRYNEGRGIGGFFTFLFVNS